MCEYSHAMGNSNGTLDEYWDAIESTPGLQGGFIWEFRDHGLVQTLPDGRTRWAYGGDFGEQPHDGTFVCDGMVWPDRRPKPAMWEHKRLAAPVRIGGSGEDIAAGRIDVANHSISRTSAGFGHGIHWPSMARRTLAGRSICPRSAPVSAPRSTCPAGFVRPLVRVTRS